MDRSAWQSDNKTWLKERKAFWAEAEKNLKHADRFDTLYRKYFKDYCLYGILPEDEDGHYYDENITLPLVILLWFYPRYDYDKWLELTHYVVDKSYDFKRDIELSYQMIFTEGCSYQFCKTNGLGDGFFLGDEEKLVDFFCKNEKALDLLVPANPLQASFKEYSLFGGTIDAFSRWFNQKTDVNPYITHIYLFDNFLKTIKNNSGDFLSTMVKNSDNLTEFGRYNSLFRSLKVIATVQENGVHYSDKPRLGMYEKLIVLLESDDLPCVIKQAWGEAKDGSR